MVNGYLFLRVVRSVSLVVLVWVAGVGMSTAQEHSVAKQWNEILLESIRNDFARPTVHARNLWHSSVLMYDCFAAYDPVAEPFFLGREVSGFTCNFEGVPTPEDIQAAQEEAMSYAMYRLILHRFVNAPGIAEINFLVEQKMADLGYDPDFTSTDYTTGSPAALGNYIVEQMIEFGHQDGANEQMNYGNTYYAPVNEPLDMGAPGNPDVVDPNRWQPLVVEGAIDQAGNPVNPVLDFLSPEWGDVVHFALDEDDLTVKERDGFNWNVYVDPGEPPYLNEGEGLGLESLWKWGHIMVAIWQSHHDPTDGVMIDASPNTIGNNPELPTTFEEFLDFYDFFEGGDSSQGHDINPATGEPYATQMVPRADYARVLAEFWADGPDSETPPGHWFTILNEVNDHPMLEKRWNGQGPVLSDLEWDVKTYFTLGSGMHDAAIAAWSVKGFYDYSRPVSAIRHMAEMGQCTDDQLPNFHPDGFPLIPGYVELVMPGDPLVGPNDENLYEIKLFTWRGPDFIPDPETTNAGVGWILAKNWWPYQRPTFVTPPFAGYVSGHSTYSRTAAEIMALMTGDAYFPGGMSWFDAPQNEFLVFEEGPSQFVELQWATYVDASDQCSLSRIWGGIHPPADDIPGRIMGKHIGPKVYNKAVTYFNTDAPRVVEVNVSNTVVNDGNVADGLTIDIVFDQNMNTMVSPGVTYPFDNPTANSLMLDNATWSSADTYTLTYSGMDVDEELFEIYLQINNAEDPDGNVSEPYVEDFAFVLDTRQPLVSSLDAPAVITDADAEATVSITISFDEAMDEMSAPEIIFSGDDPLANSLSLNTFLSNWSDATTYEAVFDVADANEELNMIDLEVVNATDAAGNPVMLYAESESFAIDTRNPVAVDVASSEEVLNDAVAAAGTISVTVSFDEIMNTDIAPILNVNGADPFAASLTLDEVNSGWSDDLTYVVVYNTADADEDLGDLEISFSGAQDMNGNEVTGDSSTDVLFIDTENPMMSLAFASEELLSDSETGTGGLIVDFTFSEEMDVFSNPLPNIIADTQGSLEWNEAESEWSDAQTYSAVFDVIDENVEISEITFSISDAVDMVGNVVEDNITEGLFDIDTRNPQPIVLSANDYELNMDDTGAEGFSLITIFDEPMNQSIAPFVLFPVESPATTLTLNNGASGWINNSTYETIFDVADDEVLLLDIDVVVTGAVDLAGNLLVQTDYTDFFDIDINSVSVNENGETSFSAFPNPISAGEDLMMTIPQSGEWNVSLFSATGQLVNEWQSIQSANGLFRIATADLAPGMYVIAINGNDLTHTLRFEVVR